jgi:hypothetical protein
MCVLGSIKSRLLGQNPSGANTPRFVRIEDLANWIDQQAEQTQKKLPTKPALSLMMNMLTWIFSVQAKGMKKRLEGNNEFYWSSYQGQRSYDYRMLGVQPSF